MKLLYKNILLLALGLLVTHTVSSQDSLGPQGGIFVNGGKWQSAGDLLHLSVAGQIGASNSLQSSDSSYVGTVGILAPTFRLGNNARPIAITPDFTVYIDEDLQIILEGYDPDGDPIDFDISTSPANGNLRKLEGTLNLFQFVPGPGLSPETLYDDQVDFVVRELLSGLQSEVANVPFSFRLPDTQHAISDLTYTEVDANTGTVTLSWTDTVINNSYSLDVSYYDLSDPNNPAFRNLLLDSIAKADLTISGTSISYSFNVNSTNDPYLFTDSRIFMTAFVSTPNGNSDFDSYTLENGSAARIETSEDGLFFAFGSPMSVTENRSVDLRLIGVELNDAGIGDASIEILSQPFSGTVTSPRIEKTTQNARTWLMTYTGTAQVGGRDSIQFRVFNPARQEFDTAYAKIVIVDVNDPPKVTAVANQLMQEDGSLSIPLKFTDPDSEVEVIVESNEASGVPVTYSNDSIKIRPAANFNGLVSINVIIREKETEESYVAYDRFDLEIEPVNDPPVVTAITDQSIDEDNNLTISLAASDVDSRTAEFDFTANVDDPSQIAVTVVDNSLQIVPAENVFGTFEIEVKADDRLGLETSRSEGEIFTMTVNPINDAPEILKQFPSQTIVTGLTDYSINMKAYFTDVESADLLTYSISGNSNITVTFNGAAANVAVGSGFSALEEATITASDGELTVQQNISFVPVTQSADIQVASVADVTLDEDFGTSTLNISSIFSDANNANAAFTYSLLGNSFIDVSISDQGLITFTSTENFNGEESMILVGTTGDKSNFTSFKVIVNPVNDAPVAGLVADQTTLEDNLLENVFIKATDIDSDDASLEIFPVFSTGSLYRTSNLEFTKANNGWLMNITPPENYFGVDSIQLVVFDGGLRDTTSIRIEVQPVNDAPVISIETLSDATEDSEYSFDFSSVASDVENSTITYELVTSPDWLSLAGSVVSGTPVNENVGDASLGIRLTDAEGASINRILPIKVVNTNDAPILVASLADISVLQESNWTYNFPVTSFTDVDAGDQLTYSFEEVPSWATISGNQVTGNPQYDDLGQYQMILRATDQEGSFVQDTIAVSVEFTVYDVDISVEEVGCDQSAGTTSFSASGAVSYNWYNSAGDLIENNVGTLTVDLPFDGGAVEGVDALGRTTPYRISIEATCAILSIANNDLQLEVYPNPASDRLILKSNRSDFEYQVFDMLGRQVAPSEVESISGQVQLDITSLSNGVYLIKYTDENEEKLLRFIKR